MNVLKEKLLNQLIKFKPVRALAKLNHRTGINSDQKKIDATYQQYFKFANPNGAKVFELGPGHTFGIMEKAKQAGASDISILDIEKYIDDATLEKIGIQYATYDGKQMPYQDEAFDISCSHTVLEHVRYPEITIKEIARVTKKGGHSVHFIDLQDHFFLGADNENLFNCLQYSDETWKAMTWNRSNYVNRLRYSDWTKLFEKNNLKITSEELITSDCIQKLYAKGEIDYLKKYNEKDAVTSMILLYCEKK